MGWLIGIGVLVIFGGGFALARALTRRAVDSAVLGSQLDTRKAEDAAAEQTQREAQSDANVVLRASDDDLRAEVERLRSRGQSGK